MPQYNKEIQDQIAREAQEAGIQGYKSPVGLHHVKFTEVKVLSDGNPRLQLGVEILCGPFVGRKIVMFQGYFANQTSDKDPDGSNFAERQKQSTGIFKGFFNGLRESRGEIMEELRDAVMPLSAEFEYGDEMTKEEVATVMEWLTDYLPEIDGYLKIADKTDSDFQTYRFVKAKDTTCECEVA